jgi:branched-chain amino acid transport system ATP-binding protein
LAPPEQRAAVADGAFVDTLSGPGGLTVRGLEVGYGRRQVVFGVDLHVGEGEIVAMMGHNGAGKTTTIGSIFGFIKPIGGTVEYRGRDAIRDGCAANVRNGMSLIPAEQFVFAQLSVLDNLRIGAFTNSDRPTVDARMAEVFELFPILEDRLSQAAGTLSGGQQRMLSLGISLMTGPSLILLDEPSLGLAPAVVEQIMNVVRRLADERGVSVLLLEQNVTQALRVADRAYVMRSGRIILEESAEAMRARDSYWDLF